MLVTKTITTALLQEAFTTLYTAKCMTELYEEHQPLVAKYVHATSRGHEAIQIAVGMQLLPQDYVFPYYRDDAMLLAMGITPYELMLQLLAKKDDPFSAGRSYYSHPSLRREGMPKIPHQSSATGMQAIPATGVAMGMQYKDSVGIATTAPAVVVCSLGDAAVTEGEVAEALQMAALRQLPIVYVIQDNGWDISANAAETRAQNAYEYAKGFHGIEAMSIDGANFEESYLSVQKAIDIARLERRPVLLHARVPLLNHHTSGVRMEWYRDDLEEAKKRDPYPVVKTQLMNAGSTLKAIAAIESEVQQAVRTALQEAIQADDPTPEDLYTHDFAPTPITEEVGERSPASQEKVVMVDSALAAIEELMRADMACVCYGQDVGARLGGVFRETATLADKFGSERVFNTAIQEAFIIGSTVGMSAVGVKPIVEVQFADYIWPGLNQLFTEVSRSCYLSNGKWPVSMVLRVPTGAYGSGGPYHSSSIESILTNIRGIKIAYPSNGADLKGLLKAAYYDPNPVVILEHKGLYWSKLKGTERAKTVAPAANYVLPLGKANVVQRIWPSTEETVSIITYGMGVHWALNATEAYRSVVEVIDLRTLYPLDETTVMESVKKTKKCLIITEEPTDNSFARALASRVQESCFWELDAPVLTIGAENLPAIPLNSTLEQEMILSVSKVKAAIEELLQY